MASRKRGAENAGAEITAQVVTSSSAAAPSLGGHCHPGAHLPPLSMARAAQASLAEHLQLPQAKLTPLDHPEPPRQDKGILRKAGFHLKNSLLRARSGTGQEGSSVLPFQIWGSWGAEAERAQAPPPRLAAQAATMEGRDCREQEISFSQPKSTLKGQNPQTVPKSQGWRWEGTAAWQQQGTDQSCHSQQLQQLQPSHCSPWGAAHGRAGLRGDMGKQKWAVENRLDESHGQSRSCCDHLSESQTPRRSNPARGSPDRELLETPAGSRLGFAGSPSTQEHGASVPTEEAPLPPPGEGGPSLPWLSRAHCYHQLPRAVWDCPRFPPR